MMAFESGDSREGSWLAPSRNSAAKVQLFFLPHAGAGTAVYHGWKRLLPGDVDLCPVQIPGRESRLGEASYTDAEALIEEIALAMASRTDKPYAIFGHSMGALLALDLAFRLREHGQPDPLYLFVSGRNATHIPLSVKHGEINKLSDEEFLEALAIKYGGLPREILETPELLEVYLPILRADLTLLEMHRFQKRPPLNCPIAAFAGRQDENVSPEGLDAWREHTSGRFESRLFDGSHFYLNGSSRPQLVDLVTARLNEAFSGISSATPPTGTDAR